MIQQFNLGKFLGKRYIDELQFLSPHYRSEEIFVISTDTNRTIQSATANMMGMYGGRGRCGIGKSLDKRLTNDFSDRLSESG